MCPFYVSHRPCTRSRKFPQLRTWPQIHADIAADFVHCRNLQHIGYSASLKICADFFLYTEITPKVLKKYCSEKTGCKPSHSSYVFLYSWFSMSTLCMLAFGADSEYNYSGITVGVKWMCIYK